MRKGLQNLENNENKNYKIIAVDDEEGIIDSLSIFLKRSGYEFVGVTNPEEAVEKVRNEHFDLMVLDFIMTPIHGDQVVEEIREFNKDLYILGIAEGKYDFYYVGCDNDYNIQLISCALSIKKNKDRDRDYMPPFESDFKEWSKKSNKLWKQITKNVKKYFKDNPQDKLLYFVRSSIFSEE